MEPESSRTIDEPRYFGSVSERLSNTGSNETISHLRFPADKCNASFTLGCTNKLAPGDGG